MLPICHLAVNKKSSRFLRICAPDIQRPVSTRLLGLSPPFAAEFHLLLLCPRCATGQPRWTFFTAITSARRVDPRRARPSDREPRHPRAVLQVGLAAVISSQGV